jgi:predicted nuclease of predicted toxin-antitoxin system
VRFKLDENCDPRWQTPLIAAGHAVSTVHDEGLQGAEDETIASACRSEGRCLITADLDFAQLLDFPPENSSGFIVLRHPRPTLAGMQALLEQVVLAVAKESPSGRLWIVEPGRIRIHLRAIEYE